MKHDPFGSLKNWETVLARLEELADTDQLKNCQPGLIRILQYKGNWQLREEVLKHVGEIQTPSEKLVLQVLSILADDNTYYDVRILAGDALVQLLKKDRNGPEKETNQEIRKVVDKLRSTPQPSFLEAALARLGCHIENTRRQ